MKQPRTVPTPYTKTENLTSNQNKQAGTNPTPYTNTQKPDISTKQTAKIKILTLYYYFNIQDLISKQNKQPGTDSLPCTNTQSVTSK